MYNRLYTWLQEALTASRRHSLKDKVKVKVHQFQQTHDRRHKTLIRLQQKTTTRVMNDVVYIESITETRPT